LIGGNITNDGGNSIVLRGVCYSTSPNPNMGNSRTEDGSGIGSFSTILRNLSPSTTYYARSYAKNSQGVVVYGNEVSFSTGTPIPGVRCPGTPSVTDIDGNLYYTVQIGTQCWTQSNLKVSKYRNGDNIPTGLGNSSWGSTTPRGAYAIYDNNSVNDGLYGKLYNHYAVMDTRGLCPTGWHVPTDGEWNVMVKFLDPNADTGTVGWQNTSAGGALKSTATQPTPGGWNSPNAGAINSSGFSAGPGGLRQYFGDFENLGINGIYLSSSLSGTLAFVRWLSTFNGDLIRTANHRATGSSVRCLRDFVGGGTSMVIPTVTTASATAVTATSANTGGDVTQDGGAPVTARGVAYGTSANPTTSGTITTDGTGTGVFTSTLTGLTPSTTYNVRAYATNSVGTAYGNEFIFTTGSVGPSFACGTSTVIDIDNNTYNTLQIGTQCWTQSNLKVSKYRNGDNIPTGLSNTAWENTTAGAYAIYNNDPVNDGLYGKLYNHYAVIDTRGLCPTGWHVPTDEEWNVMVKFLDPNADTVCSNCWQSGIAGGALKSTAIQPTPGGWNSPNAGAINSSGFSAGPGGRRDYEGSFFALGSHGLWWSSSSTWVGVWYRYLYTHSGGIGRINTTLPIGISVRCLRD